MKMPIAILVLVALVPRVGAGPPPPSADELERIEARGRLLHRLDEAARVATDARARGDRAPTSQPCVCRDRPRGATCVFGALAPERDAFAVDAVVEVEDGVAEIVERDLRPREERWLVTAARAIEAAAAVFPFDAASDSYGSIVVPGPESSATVYFYPTTERSGAFVRGADGEVVVDADGKAKVAFRHPELEFREGHPPSGGGVHAHADGSPPDALDVFRVLQSAAASERVTGPGGIWEIDATGAIRAPHDPGPSRP